MAGFASAAGKSIACSLCLSSLMGVLSIGLVAPTQAQITPDGTMGGDRSTVTPNATVRGLPAELIQGGARRGANLFHSFERFHVRSGQRVYFANPVGIETILSRVTGREASQILGTLGVAGNANLFLLNPNGILFGAEARLDVAGSFVATTADRLRFGDGQEFSATNPQAPPLLSVNLVPGLQVGQSRSGATIANLGKLATGQDLILIADRLDVQGQLQAGRQLLLHAQDSLRIRDSLTLPFVAQAGGNLTLRGDRAIDILALSHPDTRIQSSGDLSLISDAAASGDAHFTSGGNFAIRTSSGAAGDFVSLFDPIVRAVGDVSFGNYTGAALKVEATGSIRGGNIRITSPDTAASIPSTDPDFVALTTRNAVILRAGVPVAVAQNFPSPQFTSPTTPNLPNLPTGSIQVGTIVTWADPNPGGPVTLSALGNITVDGISTAGDNNAGLGADIRLTSQTGAITVTTPATIGELRGATLAGRSLTVDAPGAVNLSGRAAMRSDVTGAAGDILIGTAIVPAAVTVGAMSSRNLGGGDGGSIIVRTHGAFRATDAFTRRTVDTVPPPLRNTDPDIVTIVSEAAGNGGTIEIVAAGDIAVAAGINSSSFGTSSGANNAGSVTLISRTGAIDTSTGLLITTSTSENGGAITLTAAGDLTVGDMNSGGATSGTIRLSSGAAFLADDRTIRSDAAGNGRAGDITIAAAETLTLSNETIVASGTLAAGRGGDVSLQAGEAIVLTNGAAVIAGTQGTGRSGDVTIRTPGLLQLSGVSPTGDASEIVALTIGPGDAGNIDIKAGRLVLRDGGIVSTTVGNEVGAVAAGQGGDITVQASTIDLSGTSPDGLSPSRFAAATFSTGDSGDLTVNTDRLTVQNGALLATATVSRAPDAGKAGNLTITARDTIELAGISPNGQVPSVLSTDTFGPGQAGNLQLTTARLRLRDGAAASVSTFGAAQGGRMTVSASEEIELSGTAANGFASGLYAQAFADGNAGDLQVSTGRLIVRDRATITVASGAATDSRVPTAQPNFPVPRFNGTFGNAGNLAVTARSVRLNNFGQLLASTASSEGGNIQLDVDELMTLRRNSLISATAGTAQAGGNGGNIDIKADFVVSAPLENSDIKANAFLGRGGNVTVTAESIIWLQPRSRAELDQLLEGPPLDPIRLPTNDITAISQQNPTLNGVVTLNTPDVDPSRGLVALPENLTDPSRQIAQGCVPRGVTASSFVDTGRGGLPPSPTDPIVPAATLTDWISLPPDRPPAAAIHPVPPDRPPTEIIEAQGWIVDANGDVILVAAAPTVTPQRSWFSPIACPGWQ
jgi:filamentous hemagglutinin family protein